MTQVASHRHTDSDSEQEHVPFFDLSMQMNSLSDEILEAIRPILASGAFIGGGVVSEFEERFARYCGAKYCISLHSGTAALHLALLALDLEPGAEVITAANSFVATAEGIAFANCKPVLVDIDPSTYNLDPELLEKCISAKTRAIIPVHLYGQPAAMKEIGEIAASRNIHVIEDSCQAHGAELNGRRAGSFAQMACFSFYPSKNLGAAGDGGAIVTSDPSLADRIRLLRNHGSKVKYHHEILGHNFRLDAIQAAILTIKLRHLDKWNEQRRNLAKYYDEQLSKISGIVIPATAPGAHPVYHLYVIQVDDRAAIEKALTARGIGSGVHYPVPIHLQPAFSNLGYAKGDFPITEKAAGSIISLPMYPEMSRSQQDRVISALREALPEKQS